MDWGRAVLSGVEQLDSGIKEWPVTEMAFGAGHKNVASQTECVELRHFVCTVCHQLGPDHLKST